MLRMPLILSLLAAGAPAAFADVIPVEPAAFHATAAATVVRGLPSAGRPARVVTGAAGSVVVVRGQTAAAPDTVPSPDPRLALELARFLSGDCFVGGPGETDGALLTAIPAGF
jgi:hypothetical protein